MKTYLYLPRDIEYVESGVNLLERIFKTEVLLITRIPLEEPIENGILWINSHGYKRTGDHDYMIEAGNVKPEFKKYVKRGQERDYIESVDLPKFFNVKNSLIIFDSCYSSEINISTLSNWKSNSILTTGYVPDVYNTQWSGLIKFLCMIHDKFIAEKKGTFLTPELIRENKETVNNLAEFVNFEYGTEFSLF